MGTLTLRRFGRKVQAFEAALDEGVFRRHFKRDEFEVLVLTQSRRRLEALRQISACVAPGGRRDLYYFASFEALSPPTFESAEWIDLGRQDRQRRAVRRRVKRRLNKCLDILSRLNRRHPHRRSRCPGGTMETNYVLIRAHLQA